MRAPASVWHERGAVTVLAVVFVAVLATMAVLVAAVGGAVADQRRAASAADLSALAGAAAVQAGRAGCAAATMIALRNGARLTSCEVRDQDVVVGTAVQTRAVLGRRLTVRSAARAGPAEIGLRG